MIGHVKPQALISYRLRIPSFLGWLAVHHPPTCVSRQLVRASTPSLCAPSTAPAAIPISSTGQFNFYCQHESVSANSVPAGSFAVHKIRPAFAARHVSHNNAAQSDATTRLSTYCQPHPSAAANSFLSSFSVFSSYMTRAGVQIRRSQPRSLAHAFDNGFGVNTSQRAVRDE